MANMDEGEEIGSKRRSSDPPKPIFERSISKKGRRSSVAASGLCGGGSAEKKKSFHGKHRKFEHDRKKSQRKASNFGMRSIDPLNLMGLSEKKGCDSPKVDSPQIGDRGLNFDPGNLRPVDVTDPLKLNDLEDNVLAVKINSHKKKRKRKRRRTYSENDKDMQALYESMGHDGDTETSENEIQSPKKFEMVKKKMKGDMEIDDDKKINSIDEKEGHILGCSVYPDNCEAKTEQSVVSENGGVRNHEVKKEEVKKDEVKRDEVTDTCENKIDDESQRNLQSHKVKVKLDVDHETKPKQYNIKFREKDKKFQYGNYNRYYGYRNPKMSEDERMDYMKREWFVGKDCLDVGCNVGHLTLYIAKHFHPKSFIGIDIDQSLIRSAKKNIQHYVSLSDPQDVPKKTDFTISFPMCPGEMAAPISPDEDGKSCHFPHNVSFKTENFVDFDWSTIKIAPKYDFIMCLSVTKWVHLNWGDAGVKKLFKRLFLSLYPGGKLLLEPQPWKSYKKKKNLTLKIRTNFDIIKFKPDDFIQYLLSDEIGFAKSEKLGIPKHRAQGFQRPMYLLTKGGSQQSELSEKTSSKLAIHNIAQT